MQRRAFPDGDDSNFGADDLTRMPYLWAVCQESLRLFPPVPITNRTSVQDDVWMVDGKPCPIPKVRLPSGQQPQPPPARMLAHVCDCSPGCRCYAGMQGTPVFILPYVMHHNPDHWEDPEEFR